MTCRLQLARFGRHKARQATTVRTNSNQPQLTITWASLLHSYCCIASNILPSSNAGHRLCSLRDCLESRAQILDIFAAGVGDDDVPHAAPAPRLQVEREIM